MTRIQIELSDEQMKKLELLMSVTGVRTKKELLTNALTLFAWAVREKQEGRAIASIDHDQVSREVLIPALEVVNPLIPVG